MIAYSWPSRNSVFEFHPDYVAARLSSLHFRMLLEWLAREPSIDGIHVVAHSLGAVLVASTVHDLYLAKAQHKLGQVVLVSPAMDVDSFIYLYFPDDAPRIMEGMSIYSSKSDRALGLFKSRYRLVPPFGEIELDAATTDWLNNNPNVAAIDVNRPSRDFFGHKLHTHNPAVSSDMVLLLGYKMQSPRNRGLRRIDGIPAWQFPPAYEEELCTKAQAFSKNQRQ